MASLDVLGAWRRKLTGTGRGPFARAVITLAGGTAIAQAIAVLVSPIIARLYAPSALGELAVFSSILSTALVIASLRYDMAIAIPADDDVARDLGDLSLSIVGFVAVVIGLGTYLQFERLVPAGIVGRTTFATLLAAGVLTGGSYQAASYLAARAKKYQSLAGTRVVQSVATVGLQLGGGLFNLGAVGLILADAMGRAIGTGRLNKAVAESPRRQRFSWSRMRQVAVDYRRFPLLAAPSALVNALGLSVPILLFAGAYGTKEAGLLALGQRLIAAPLALIGQAVSQVYLPEASRLHAPNKQGVLALFKKSTKAMFLLSLAPAIVLLAFGPALFAAVFGANWREAGGYARSLSVAFLFQATIVPLSPTLAVTGRQDVQLAWDILRLALTTGAIVLARGQKWGPQVAIMTLSAAMAFSYIVLWLACYVSVSRGHSFTNDGTLAVSTNEGKL